MVGRFHEWAQNHCLGHFQKVNFMVLAFYLNNAIEMNEKKLELESDFKAFGIRKAVSSCSWGKKI